MKAAVRTNKFVNFQRPVLSALCEDATSANFLPAVLSAHGKDSTNVNFPIEIF